ncbi:hypothetical protein [Asanoa sp. NPDC050611]|uniref:hypothetical protein n=1 Tax=Asanoa sp. NPDC050611 TaxID=3157098 RepID=UPI0033E0DCDD
MTSAVSRRRRGAVGAAVPAGRRREVSQAIVARLLTARAVIVDVIELVCVARPSEDTYQDGGKGRDDVLDRGRDE